MFQVLERMVAQYQEQAPVEQLRALAAERDAWQAEASRQRERARVLEETLEGARRKYEKDVAHLQEEIRALNRIIVEQQEVLNAQNR